MTLRGIRGAVQASKNSKDAVRRATTELVEAVIKANALRPEKIVAAFFTVTDDLDATFPAEAARALGWTQVPMLCSREIPVPGSMARVVRALLLVNTRVAAGAVRHIYLGETQCLRPDLSPPAAEEEKGKRRSGATQKLRARLLGRSLSQDQANTTSSEGKERP